MGILNATPDSFSDGGEFLAPDVAVEHALQMVDQGADIIDVGGESTRPGAEPVTIDEELARVIPVITALRNRCQAAISIDTVKPEVMRAAINSGADMVNDVNALNATGAIETCAELKVPVCLMHMQGEPRTMQQDPHYVDVVEDIKDYLQDRVTACVRAGIARENIIIDPGFGFGKTLEHNWSLLKHLNEFRELGLPVLVGMSRKSMLGKVLDAEVDDRLYGSIAAAVLAYTRGARIFRVHDVRATVDALKVCQAMSAAP
ncbi:MAG: dihydropteroate synthase [Gammaproteobacteria bacterium]|nr:MAG: dihydropteroate synthase [Gammaproteobacteria bacterium]